MVDFGVDAGALVTSFDSFGSSLGGSDVDFVESSGAVGASSDSFSSSLRGSVAGLGII